MKRTILLVFLAVVSCKKDPIQYNLSVSPVPDIGGFVNPTQGVYDAGANVQILASANQGYRFTRWSGSFNGTAPIATITMNGDKNITANFEDLDLDKDGVLNAQDLCGNSPPGQAVDSNGCAASQRDSDGDGVTDNADLCDNTSSSAALVSSTGCEIEIFYFAENGVTIKADPLAPIGSQETLMERHILLLVNKHSETWLIMEIMYQM